MPGNIDGLSMLTRQIGFVKRTHYGDFWHVKVKSMMHSIWKYNSSHNDNVKVKHDANNLAYTGASLGLHTDLPYYQYTPGNKKFQSILTGNTFKLNFCAIYD